MSVPDLDAAQAQVVNSVKDPLRVEQVEVRLGERLVLTGVNLRVGPDELVGLIGPNGAGKTTLLRSMLALVPLAGGRIEVFGQAPAQARMQIGYVPQRHEFAWDFPIDVMGAVLSGRVRAVGLLRRPNATDRSAAAEAIEQVSLTGLARRPIGQLSGGQRQRVLVARALAARPRLLLLDEPFTGLDAATQEVLGVVVTEFANEGRAAVMTTHDLPAAAAMSTRLCLINRRVIADAAPKDLRGTAAWMETFGVPSPEHLSAALGRSE
jgi:manganese/iron transport system ATP-binding protein